MLKTKVSVDHAGHFQPLLLFKALVDSTMKQILTFLNKTWLTVQKIMEMKVAREDTYILLMNTSKTKESLMNKITLTQIKRESVNQRKELIQGSTFLTFLLDVNTWKKLCLRDRLLWQLMLSAGNLILVEFILIARQI